MSEQINEKPVTSLAMTGQGFMPTNLAEAWQFATNLSKSDLVPQDIYQDKPANCLIALDLASRWQMPWLGVMSHVYIVHGRPALDATLTTALVNRSGAFRGPIEYQVDGDEGKNTDPSDESYKVRAYATRHGDTEPLFGPWITWKLVHAEKWDQPKKGMPSKWTTMPDQMFHYRAASWFQRRYCPDLTFGMMSVDEAQETEPIVVDSQDVTGASTEPGVNGLRSRMAKTERAVDEAAAGSDAEEKETDKVPDEKKPRQRLLVCSNPKCAQELRVAGSEFKEHYGESCRCGKGAMITKSEKKKHIQDAKENVEAEQHEADKQSEADRLAAERDKREREQEAEKTAAEKFGDEDEVVKKYECSNCGVKLEVGPGDESTRYNKDGIPQCPGCLRFEMEPK